MTLKEAAQAYLNTFDNTDTHRQYKLNAAAVFRRAYYTEREQTLWGQHKRLAEVAREIVGGE
jgi:chromosome condensin MukBEF ATPase and DNA-binding subunit MukB